MHKSLNFLFSGLFLILTAAGLSLAEDVSLDKEFGYNGLVITKLGFRVDQATSIALQDDGKIVVAGSSDNGLGSKLAVIRYLPDGLVDHEFFFSAGGSLGTVDVDDSVHAVAFGDNGLILLGGTLNVDGYRQGVVVRLLGNGQLDLSFGLNGIAYIDVDSVDSEIRDLATDEQGRIIVAGFIDDGTNENPLISRFSNNGESDQAFNNGTPLVDYSINGRGAGLVELADGKLLVGGYSVREDGWKGLYLARFQEDGSTDDQFGNEGRAVWFDDREQIIAHDIALSLDEKIILAGEVESASGQYRIMLARYEKDGQPDQLFGENGVLVHDNGLDSRVYSVVVHRDTTIVAAGYQVSTSGKDMVIIRYLPRMDSEVITKSEDLETETSSLTDESVEIIKIAALSVTDGPLDLPVAVPTPLKYEADLITTEIAGSDEVGNDVLIAEDGSIYTVGSSGDADNSAFMVARYSGVFGDGDPVGSTGATVTQFYRIGTMPVTGVTRVGATTGGNIVLNESSDGSICVEDCQTSCEEVPEDTTCIDQCQSSCLVPEITQRGVVYSVNPNPEYDDGTGDGVVDAGDGGEVTPTDNGDGSTGFTNVLRSDGYFVRQGQTNDGSGLGSYVSEIEAVNPQTVYYVRAYGLVSDGSVIYGNEYRFKTNDSCFIATAAFGSIDTFAVRALRMFRDQYLIPHEWGKSVVNTYYFLSPTIADLIAPSPLLRILVILLLTPAVAGAIFLVFTTALMKCIIITVPVSWYLCRLFIREYGIVHE